MLLKNKEKKDKSHKLQRKILSWYQKNKRDLPWRKTREPYKILVSEMMLQQTQVSRVIPKYAEWLKQFPTIQLLSKAKTSDVLRLWSGLGYNRRALYLQKTARMIIKSFNGQFPRTFQELMKLPGIGEYTAKAVLCFAFDEQIAVVDTNIRRVILTHFQMVKAEPLSRKEVQRIAGQLLPKGRAYEWNQALMDYSAETLKDKKILIPKQSKFIGSHRYYRGKILKLLLLHEHLGKEELGKLLKEDFSEKDLAWLETLIGELLSEGFVKFQTNELVLAS